MASAYIPQFQSTNLFSTFTSLTGTLLFVRTIFNEIKNHIPEGIRDYIVKFFYHILNLTSPDHMTIRVDEHVGLTKNQVYEAVEGYLRTIIDQNINCLNVSKTPRQKNIIVSIGKGQKIVDTFEGNKISWKYVSEKSQNDSSTERFDYDPFSPSLNTDKNYFQMVFEKKLRKDVEESYLPYVMRRYEQIKNEEKVVRLYTREGVGDSDEINMRTLRSGWTSVRLEHPVTFDKLAMEPELRKMIIDDLDRFVSRKEYYERIGKVWKRGYLLYGPPGTGKTSFIAAMANYLNFDIYDLMLSSISSDSVLRRTLMSTTNRSILIIEDIDCNAKVQNRSRGSSKKDNDPKLTLSGILNFIDGLWSSCGDERIIVFTTNRKEMLDAALLRPGRMDIHINLSYCTPASFRTLANMYLGPIESHPLCEEIEKLLTNAKVTPAEVAEELMRSEDPDISLSGVLSLMKQKISEPQLGEIAPMHQVNTN